MDLAVVPPWIPEDDLLLKNAVEAGASLESLAKGAVRFSRRYSLTELQDRWRLLLYDPDVSAAAAASIVNLELSGLSSKSGGSGTKEASGEGLGRKRKVQTVRKQYYAMRKRLCSQGFFDSFDMALQDEMCIEKKVDGYDECLVGVSTEEGSKVRKIISVESGKNDDNGVSLVQGNLNKDMNQLLVNNLVGYGNYSGLEDVGPSHSMNDVPLWKTIEDVSAPAMPVQVSLENKNHSVESKEMLPHGLKGKCASAIDDLKVSAAMPGEDVTHLPDSLLNLTNEDELVVMDVDGKDAADKPCYDNVDSLLLSSPIEIQENDASDIHEARKLDTETKLGMPSRLSATGLEVANPLDHSHGDQHSISDPVDGVPLSRVAQGPHSAHSEEFMICLLNTEDPDIPSNDGPDLSIVVPLSVTLKSQPIVKEVGSSDSSINDQRKSELDGSSKKEDIPSQSYAASQIVRSGLVSNINSSHQPVVVVKTENHGSNPICAVSGQSNNVNINPSHSRVVRASMAPALDGRLKQQEIDAPASAKVYAHPKAVEHKGLPKSDANPLSLNLEADDYDDDDNDDDNDIPYFSDAETMVLEMDLCPSDQDTNASQEVLRYQHEETKRTVLRLEQCAQSFMRRAIASHGAIAVLYGRKLKQYIKKSEVILGRATDDFQVDIDLGREGRANKISRRQALIKMEADGSFIIKNLGKGSIFLNGKEVATGQQRVLSASSLIEIRGMSFIFETNDKSIREFLKNVDKR